MSCSYFIVFQRLKSLAVVAIGGTVTFGAICAYNNDEKLYREALMPMMHRLLSPEASQTLGLYAAKFALIPRCKFQDTDILVFVYFLHLYLTEKVWANYGWVVKIPHH